MKKPRNPGEVDAVTRLYESIGSHLNYELFSAQHFKYLLIKM